MTDLKITHSEQVFVSDITYINTDEGHAYLALVTDAYSRKLNSFYYQQPFNFEKLFHKKSLTIDEMENIKGGFSLNFFIPSPFMRRNDVNFTTSFAQNKT
ncbi:MAG: hypothetical protein PHW92_01520 [Lutibacter sp.]|nr:hypothetical protein [Lutibacter sp.]